MNKITVILQAINTLDIFRNMAEGLIRKTAVAGDLDLGLTLDGTKLLNWNDATLFFSGLGVYGNDPSKNVGDIQAVNSVAVPNDWKPFEAW